MSLLLTAKAYLRRARPPAPKAQMLCWLDARGFAVPDFRVFVPEAGAPPDPAILAPDLPPGPCAVRSAALVEDREDRSYAGQFTTVLAVTGAADTAEAIAKVLEGAGSERVGHYHGSGESLAQHVIVQTMVAGRVSGVAFSRNPLTGLNEIVIEAVEGAGEKLVGQGITPERHIWRGIGEVAAPEHPILPGTVAKQIASDVARIEKRFGRPVDLEWTWDGETLWWLQLRPITGLETVRLYSNRISREVMPGMVTPMVWSINVPLVNGAWIDLLERAVGPTGLKPEDLARQFAFRSYFNMTALGRVFELLGMPSDSLEVMLGLPNTPRPTFSAPQKLLRRLPRLIAFFVYVWRYERRFSRDLPRVVDGWKRAEARPLDGHDASELLAEIEGLLPDIRHAAALNIGGPLLANIYTALFSARLRRQGRDATDVNYTLGVPAFDAYDPKPALAELAARLDDGADDARAGLDRLLERFGHLSDNTNDLALATWRDEPDHVAALARSVPPAAPAHGKTGIRLDEVLKGTGWFTRLLGRRAQRFQLHREEISYHYARLYGRLRPLLRALGARLVETGRLGHPDDVFFLSIEEARQLVSAGQDDTASLRQQVAARKAEFADMRDVRMPETIYSEDFRPLPVDPAHRAREATGVGVSRGQAEGPLRVLRGFEDFSKVEPGDIIVIPFSDVSWTPVFARASGVVAEAGGMLSHSAIVAREYGIPCVVSVEGALDLPDGAAGVIDGVSGTVVVLEDAHA